MLLLLYRIKLISRFCANVSLVLLLVFCLSLSLTWSCMDFWSGQDQLIPTEKVAKLLAWENSELTKVIDFYICAQSDVFVSGYSSMFYENVVGARIASGKTNVLVPTSAASASAEDYLSPYISHRSHPAYSCFCPKKWLVVTRY